MIRRLAPLALALVVGGLEPATAAPATRGSEGVPAFGHVFLIIGENTGLSQIGPHRTPYLVGTLKSRGAWLTSYHGLHDGSTSDYVGMTSGQYTTCDVNDGAPWKCHQRVDNLFHQLDVAGVSWTEWNQSMTNPCSLLDSGSDWAQNVYATHHDPAVYYDDVEGPNGRWVNQHVVPSPECAHRVISMGTTAAYDTSAFDASLSAGGVSAFNMIIPNDCASGHDHCLSANRFGQFDAFLRHEIPLIESSPAFGSDGLILITYDEGSDAAPKGSVPFLAIGPLVKPGVYGATSLNHYGLLRTLEDGYGVHRHLGHAANAAPISGVWR
jgi:phosphatidylinositol-3-phosphatase